MPAFGTLGVKDTMEEMRVVSGQLLLKVRFASWPLCNYYNSFLSSVGTVSTLSPDAPSPRLTPPRFGPNAVINPSDDFTRVALDTIAYCSMSHRLNSFYPEQQPEFAVTMGDFLKESGQRFTRARMLQAVMYGTTTKIPGGHQENEGSRRSKCGCN